MSDRDSLETAGSPNRKVAGSNLPVSPSFRATPSKTPGVYGGPSASESFYVGPGERSFFGVTSLVLKMSRNLLTTLGGPDAKKEEEALRWKALGEYLGSLSYLLSQRPICLRYGELAGSAAYEGCLYPQNAKVRGLLERSYGGVDISRLNEASAYLESKGAFDIPVKKFTVDGRPAGVVQAAERKKDGEKDETNYDAVWVRDTAWAYFGLRERAGEGENAGLIIMTLLRYFSTPEQLKRFADATADPTLVDNSKPENKMNAPHIRFSPRLVDGEYRFDDVYNAGEPEAWNHAQNDALGLTLISLFDAIAKGLVDPAQFTEAEWKALLSFVPYFKAIKFYDFEDAGAWEENRRKNTSSIGIVTSALERLNDVLYGDVSWLYTEAEAKRLQKFSDLFGLAVLKSDVAKTYSRENLEGLIKLGYTTVRKQLMLGGESPDYDPKDARFRTNDAALLNLIFPAGLKNLTVTEKEKILGLVEPLVRERGIIRYKNDNYQCANSWFESVGRQTGDYSNKMDERNIQCRTIPNSEPEWFFDSWMSMAYGILYMESKDGKYLERQTHFLNRALSQVTPEGTSLGADGRPVPVVACTESYNVIIDDDGSRNYVASPITPLNWAKSALWQAIQAMKQ